MSKVPVQLQAVAGGGGSARQSRVTLALKEEYPASFAWIPWAILCGIFLGDPAQPLRRIES